MRSVRGDPLGLIRRLREWTGSLTLYVHPPTVAIDASTMGFLKDIEGVTTHVSAPERAAFQALLDAGLHDTVRPLVPTGYTYWDYKQLRFPRNEGMRIDFVLGSHAFANAVVGAGIHRNERKGDAPSDHVPVTVDLALDTEDYDDRPMFL